MDKNERNSQPTTPKDNSSSIAHSAVPPTTKYPPMPGESKPDNPEKPKKTKD